MRVAAAVVVAVAAFGPSVAFAQTEEARVLISASVGFQPGDQAWTDDGTFTLYDEAGRLTVGSDVSIGAFWDLGFAVRVNRGFTVGLGMHRGSGTEPIVVAGQAPRPRVFNRLRPFTATVDEGKRVGEGHPPERRLPGAARRPSSTCMSSPGPSKFRLPSRTSSTA